MGIYLRIYRIALFCIWTDSADLHGWTYLYLYLKRCTCIWFESRLNKIFVFAFIFETKFLYLYLYLIKRIWPQPWWENRMIALGDREKSCRICVPLTVTRSQQNAPLQWRHNGCDGVSNHQPRHCLLDRFFRHRSNKTLKISVTGLCEGNSPVTAELPVQKSSNAENVCIWWRHHAQAWNVCMFLGMYCYCGLWWCPRALLLHYF